MGYRITLDTDAARGAAAARGADAAHGADAALGAQASLRPGRHNPGIGYDTIYLVTCTLAHGP